VALELAQPADAEVTFLHASAEHMERLYIENPFTTDTDEKLAAEVSVLGEAARLAADRGVRSRLHLVGDEAPAAAVVSTVVGIAVARDIELIVIGSRGLGAVARTVLGSVSEGLLHRTTIPTLIVHPEPDESD
jgi:nucleotide-binding universal stress UspA family protein